MRRKSNALNSPPASEHRRLCLNPRDDSRRIMKSSIVKAALRPNKQRLKLRQLKCGYRAKIRVTLSIAGDDDRTARISGSGGVLSPSSGRKGSLGFRDSATVHGVVSVVGKRKEMEDAVRAELGFVASGDKKYDFFGVYDGHSGGHVASTCRERLHELVATEVLEESRVGDGEVCWERVMERCFSNLDEEVRGNAAARTTGSTAVAAVLAEDAVVVANCGDCRAVLSRDGVAIPLSSDHKPDRQDELERIEAAGGRVINWNGFRVLGVLATSRSIGDQYLRPFVISKPEVTVTKRTDKDEFLILASDGLWDVLSNEVACKVVKQCLEGKLKRRFSTEATVDCEHRASEAAAVLMELAMARGSGDNISVIVVQLNKL